MNPSTCIGEPLSNGSNAAKRGTNDSDGMLWRVVEGDEELLGLHALLLDLLGGRGHCINVISSMVLLGVSNIVGRVLCVMD